jgi:hypothetical protein
MRKSARKSAWPLCGGILNGWIVHIGQDGTGIGLRRRQNRTQTVTWRVSSAMKVKTTAASEMHGSFVTWSKKPMTKLHGVADRAVMSQRFQDARAKDMQYL